MKHLRQVLPTGLRRLTRRAQVRLLMVLFLALAPMVPAAEPPFAAYAYEGSPLLWREERWTVLRLLCEAFGGEVHVPSLAGVLSDPRYAVVLAQDWNGRLFGVVFAGPSARSSSTAYVAGLAVDKRYRGEGIAGLMLDALEEELQARGYVYMEREALVANGWADALARRYSGQIVASEERTGPLGAMRYYRIKIPPGAPPNEAAS